ncbi:chromate efflux transporter [Xanthobacter sp. YC-JY1]|uniref:chromate efflux transporter n=1 Tax=Xanthobacter TaxID=279 RepID=UPI001F013465|nr:chromate efflux transporter [Xanthobacter sp. YC-JY1]UJX47465.1 chromate efflux transporter [Xanthobacter sp. YC-JY1]
MADEAVETPEENSAGSPGEVFRAFLKLGLMSFGGPIAHLGYFRAELVERRRWIDDAGYADLVALCQFLPGPASSQLGFALGLIRGGGFLGGLAAWAGFTLPSAILLAALALLSSYVGMSALSGGVIGGILHGLKLVAVAVVAQAVWGMARTLAPDQPRAGIALSAIVMVTLAAGSFGQVAAIAMGAIAGLVLCRDETPAETPASGHLPVPLSRRTGVILLVVFALLLVLPPVFKAASPYIGVFDSFYRSGALVFGGGHVVLPLLQAEVVTTGWVLPSQFLAGYGLAQAVPGPLFTFAAWLGAVMAPPAGGVTGAAVALVAVFLPGLLLVTGMLPFWGALRGQPLAQAAMRGANAAVVGILGAALYTPVFTGAVLRPMDFAAAVTGFLLLTVWKVPPLAVVVVLAVLGPFLTGLY